MQIVQSHKHIVLTRYSAPTSSGTSVQIEMTCFWKYWMVYTRKWTKFTGVLWSIDGFV